METQHAIVLGGGPPAPALRSGRNNVVGALSAIVVAATSWAGADDRISIGSTPSGAPAGIAEKIRNAPAAEVVPRGSDGFQLNIGRSPALPYGQAIAVNWEGTAGGTSQVQVSSNLVTWEDVGGPIANSGDLETWQEYLPSLSFYTWPVRFYRVKQSGQAAALPSRLLNLADWKLTLPVDTAHAGSPDEIRQPELSGFRDTNYFRLNGAANGVVFSAPCGGATTSGSGYPRSELWEMGSQGTTNASWSTTSGTHTMEITQAITHLPEVKPHVVAGQIHDANDDVIVFRLEGAKLFVDQNGVNGPVLTTSYHLGDVFSVKFVARNGGVECSYNGQYIYTYKVSASGCYFKAGCYTQSNTSKGDAPSAYGEVVVYTLSVSHQ